eukprot:145131_1
MAIPNAARQLPNVLITGTPGTAFNGGARSQVVGNIVDESKRQNVVNASNKTATHTSCRWVYVRAAIVIVALLATCYGIYLYNRSRIMKLEAERAQQAMLDAEADFEAARTRIKNRESGPENTEEAKSAAGTTNKAGPGFAKSVADTTTAASDTTNAAAGTTNATSDTTNATSDTTNSASDTTNEASDTTNTASGTANAAAGAPNEVDSTTNSADGTTHAESDATQFDADLHTTNTADDNTSAATVTTNCAPGTTNAKA